jgi:hypothetical protein
MRTFLVAVVAADEQDVHDFLLASTKGPNNEDAVVDSWWIAEDDRQDRSDCDSAIFVPRGAQMDFASVRDQYIEAHSEEWRENGYPYAETDVSGQWFPLVTYSRTTFDPNDGFPYPKGDA